MSDFEKALERELIALEAELSVVPAYAKMVRVKELLASYQSQPSIPDRPAGHRWVIRAKTVEEKSKRTKVYETIERLMLTGPKHRKDILDTLISEGLMGAEKKPMASLAIYLSDSNGRFKSLGEGVWGLTSVETEGETASSLFE